VGSGGWLGYGDDVAGRVSIALELGEFWNEVPSIELVVEEFPDVPLRPSYWRRRMLEREHNRGAIEETHILARGNGGPE